MDQIRGPCLPGLFPAKIVTAIFRQQAKPWETHAREYLQQCYAAVLDFLESATYHVAGKHTGAKLNKEYIYPALDRKWELLDSKMTELMWPYVKAQPMTFNARYDAKSRFTTVVSEVDKHSAVSGVTVTRAAEARLEKLPEKSQVAAEALDRAEAYYEVRPVLQWTTETGCVSTGVRVAFADGIADRSGHLH